MNTIAKKFIYFVDSLRDSVSSKEEMVNRILLEYPDLKKCRSLYTCPYFSFRLSYSSTGSFSNTILSYKALKIVDSNPVFSIIVHAKSSNSVYLCNSTFINKLDVGTKKTSLENPTGSFNGNSIIKEYQGIKNELQNFSDLFDLHLRVSSDENLQRIVSNTQNTKSIYKPIEFSNIEINKIFNNINTCINFTNNKVIDRLKNYLDVIVKENSQEIINNFNIKNSNIRGRNIENIITHNKKSRNELGDMYINFEGYSVALDIKTHNSDNSCPKGFNIDKSFTFMKNNENNGVILLYFIFKKKIIL